MTPVPPTKDTADAGARELKIELGFSTLEGYRLMGLLLLAARERLGLPGHATPTEVLFAALDPSATEDGAEVVEAPAKETPRRPNAIGPEA